MLDLVKKAMLAGVGAITIVREKIESVADELIKRGEMAEGEKAKFVVDMTDKMVKEAQELKETIGRTAERVSSSIRGAGEEKAGEIKALREELETLKNRIAHLEGESSREEDTTEGS